MFRCTLLDVDWGFHIRSTNLGGFRIEEFCIPRGVFGTGVKVEKVGVGSA